MSTWEVWASAPNEADAVRRVEDWAQSVEAHVVPVLAELGVQQKSSGGLVHDPVRGVYDQEYTGERHVAAPSFGPECFLAFSYHAPPSMTPEVMTSASVSHDGVTLDLSCKVFGVLEQTQLDEVAGAMATVLTEHADGYRLDFGNVAGDNYSCRTSLEAGLRRTQDVARLEARQVLRGYSWVTLVPDSLVEAVLPRVQAHPGLSFTRTRWGALLVQAGPRFSNYGDAEAHRLFEAFAPVLPSGTPKKPRRFGSSPPVYLVERDARSLEGK